MTWEELRAARRYSGWHFWRGVAGVLYASRLRCSPPVVKRSPTVEGLRDQIEAEMAYRERRWG